MRPEVCTTKTEESNSNVLVTLLVLKEGIPPELGVGRQAPQHPHGDFRGNYRERLMYGPPGCR
jgi:hypothetical protein